MKFPSKNYRNSSDSRIRNNSNFLARVYDTRSNIEIKWIRTWKSKIYRFLRTRTNFLNRNDSSIEWSAKELNAQWRLVNVYRYLYLPSIHSLSARWILTRFGRARKTPCWVSFSRFIVWNVKSDKRYRQPASSRNALSRKRSWSRESFLLDATLASHSDLSSQLWPLYSTISR